MRPFQIVMGVEFVNEHHVTSLTLLFFFLEAKIFLVCGFAQKEHYQKFDPDFLSKLLNLVTP